MGVWDTTTPAGGDPRNQGDDRIRELKVAIQEALQSAGPASFPGPNPLTAPVFKPVVEKGAEASRPAASSNIAKHMYLNEDTGALDRVKDDGSVWEEAIPSAAGSAIHAADSISLASAAGVITLTELGNAFHVSGTEAVTSIEGWSSGNVIIRFTQARSITHDGSNLILIGGVDRQVAAGDVIVFQYIGADQVREIGGISSLQSTNTLPTQQVFTSGSGTYTTPTGARQLRVRVKGGGGGGGATITNNGVKGTDSSFNSIVADGGDGGTAQSGAGGAGGTGGAGSANVRIPGAVGSNVTQQYNDVNGVAQAANTGLGGIGGNDNTSAQSGGTGGEGEYIEIIINSPSATYSYAVGAGGAGGAAGNYSGGAGGSGIVIVDEIY